MKLSLFFLVMICLFSCQEQQQFYPKKRAYHRIELPKIAYQKLANSYPFTTKNNKTGDEYPYTFEYSDHVQLMPDTSFMAEPFWVEMLYPELNASVHISYKSIGGKRQVFEEYINDALKLATKHGARASSIDEVKSKTKNGDGVMLYYLEGDIPTSFQYVITDTVNHFFRAALYVPNSQKNDSLAPIIDYVREDMMHMLETFDWKE
jgi:gliding motility-associated lipoprotein GldD